jgi:cell division protein FtsZ
MNAPLPPPTAPAEIISPAPAPAPSRCAIIAIGRAGLAVLEDLRHSGLGRGASLAISADSGALTASTAELKIALSTAAHDRLATGEEMELAALDARLPAAVRNVCLGKAFVFLLAGLGGNTGTRLIPWLVPAVKAAGARVFALVTSPFDGEGRSRRQLAEAGLQTLAEQADGVLCLPGQRTAKLLPVGVPLRECFLASVQPLAEAGRGLARLLTLPASLPIYPREVCAVLRGRSCLAFATAEATGPERAREVAEKLFAHPLLAGTAGSVRTGSVILSVTGWPEPTQDELKCLTERVERGWERAGVRVGVAADETASGTLRALLLVSSTASAGASDERSDADLSGTVSDTESMPTSEAATAHGPAGALVPDEGGRVRRKRNPPAKQEQLALEMVPRGRFEKGPPTIHKCEDLDVPTYIRRRVILTQN